MKNVSILAAKRLGITSCQGNATLDDVVKRLTEEDISSLIVVDDAGYLDGIITRTDIVRAALARPDDWRQKSCRAWMTMDVITVEPDTLLQTAAELLQENDIHRVVVVQREGDNLRPLAVVSDTDVVYHLARGSV